MYWSVLNKNVKHDFMSYARGLKITSFFLLCFLSARINAQEQKKPSERSYQVVLNKIKDQLAERKALRVKMQLPAYTQYDLSGNSQFVQPTEKQLNGKPVIIMQEQPQKKPSERQMPVPVRKEVIRNVPRD